MDELFPAETGVQFQPHTIIKHRFAKVCGKALIAYSLDYSPSYRPG